VPAPTSLLFLEFGLGPRCRLGAFLPAAGEPQFLTKVIVAAGLAPTNKEAQRLVAQGGVLVDDAKVDDPKTTLDARAGRSYLLKVGKRRFARVVFK